MCRGQRVSGGGARWTKATHGRLTADDRCPFGALAALSRCMPTDAFELWRPRRLTRAAVLIRRRRPVRERRVSRPFARRGRRRTAPGRRFRGRPVGPRGSATAERRSALGSTRVPLPVIPAGRDAAVPTRSVAVPSATPRLPGDAPDHDAVPRRSVHPPRSLRRARSFLPGRSAIQSTALRGVEASCRPGPARQPGVQIAGPMVGRSHQATARSLPEAAGSPPVSEFCPEPDGGVARNARCLTWSPG